MALGVMSDTSNSRGDSARWARKMGELIQRENGIGLQRGILELIQFGQLTGVLRKDPDPRLVAGIFMEISKLYQDCRVCTGSIQGDCPVEPPGEIIDNVIGILLSGFNQEDDARENN